MRELRDLRDKNNPVDDWSVAMKRDWDDRARADAKWFINSRRLLQPEEEFDADGARDVDALIMKDLDLLTQGRDPKQMKVLELGCGIGRMTKYLASVFGEVHATDVSGEMIRSAQERLKGLDSVHFYETSGYDLSPLEDNSFDFAFSAFVFRHVPTPEIIEENLREAYRVLKPGAVMRFHTNSITVFDFEELDKDTWLGASFSEALIRRFGNDVGAQIISIYGVGKKDCWTTLRKPAGTEKAEAPPSARLKIQDFGRAPSLASKSVPVSVNDAVLTLLVSGLSPSTACCNSLTVEIEGMPVPPRFAGPGPSAAEEGLVTVEVDIPFSTPEGELEVRLVSSTGAASDVVRISFFKPNPVIPEIVEIINASDRGSEIAVQGPKSRVRLMVKGLDRTADAGNVRIQIGDRILRPASLEFNPTKAACEVEAQLPSDTQPGSVPIVLYFGNLASPAVNVDVHPA